MFHKPVNRCTFNICFQHGPAPSASLRWRTAGKSSRRGDSLGADSHLPHQRHCSSHFGHLLVPALYLLSSFRPASLSLRDCPAHSSFSGKPPSPQPTAQGSHVWDHRTLLPPLPLATMVDPNCGWEPDLRTTNPWNGQRPGFVWPHEKY